MTDWWWKPNPLSKDSSVFWDSGPFLLKKAFWIFIYPSSSSRAIGRQIIEIAQARDPISCQLYRLVYGRLP